MKPLIFFLTLVIFAAHFHAQTMPADADPKLWAKALKIHRKAIIVDGHNDVPTPMFDDNFDLGTNSIGKYHADGDVFHPSNTPYHSDLNRLKASGLTGLFFSIYVSGDYVKAGGASRRALDLIDSIYREIEKHPGKLTMCTAARHVLRAKRQNKICAFMGLEGGHAIENSLYVLRNFYRLGIRYMTLTHNVTHDWADAHRDEAKNNGLSDFGTEVVREMNRLGMFIDISHVSVKVMNDVLDISTAPIIASHSSARGINDHTRNVPDEVLKRIAKNGGVIMLNFYPSFLDARTNREEKERTERLKPQIEALQAQFKDDRQAFILAERDMLAANPIYVAPYTAIVDHIDHIKKVAGIDIVGLGSDYDGIPFLPSGMKGAEDLALVTYEMFKRGYTETDIRKVLGENLLRAMSKMESVAKIGSRKISGGGSLKKIK